MKRAGFLVVVSVIGIVLVFLLPKTSFAKTASDILENTEKSYTPASVARENERPNSFKSLFCSIFTIGLFCPGVNVHNELSPNELTINETDEEKLNEAK